MLTAQILGLLAAIGFLCGAVGGLGNELLDSFAGRDLEAYCRLKGRRERFGMILDRWEDALSGAEYLRVIGNVLFLGSGSAALTLLSVDGVHLTQFLGWLLLAAVSVMLTHLWLPDTVTRFASAPVLYHTWPLWRGLAIVTRPLAAPGRLVSRIGRRLSDTPPEDEEKEDALEDEIRTIIAAGTREGLLGKGVREMIQGVMDLHDDSVSHIMTPRSRVDALEVSTPWPEALHRIASAGRTRVPVYETALDNPLGILFVKDLLPHLANGGPHVAMRDILRPAWKVPEAMKVDELLRDFLHKRSHMALVMDEFGQVAGVVTIEDALEEIVGEIVDESDAEEQSELRIIDNTTVRAAGHVMVDELNDKLGWNLPEGEDYETIAGYILQQTGEIPAPGSELNVGPLRVRIERASNRQIERVHLEWQDQSTREAG